MQTFSKGPRLRPVLFALVLCLGLAGCSGGSGGGTAPPSPTATPRFTTGSPSAAVGKPNIILVLTDDQTAADFAYMPKTKQLVADSGMTLPLFFDSVPLCCPSRATILRGQYAHNHGVESNVAPNGGYGEFLSRNEESSTIATWLHDAGYRTGLFGKYMNRYPHGDGQRGTGDPTHVPPGWDEWDAGIANSGYPGFNYSLNENGIVHEYGAAEQDYETDVLSAKSVEFIRTSDPRSGPFFLYIAPHPPHGPATPAPRHANLFKDLTAPQGPAFNEDDVSDKPTYMRNYQKLSASDIKGIDELFVRRLESLQSVDDLVGTLVAELQASGQLDNTFIFVTSDNGFMQGQHRKPAGKQVPYEESIRVSMFVRGPGIVPASTSTALTGNVDLAPTFAQIAGVTPPKFVDGRSLLGILTSRVVPANWRTGFLLEGWSSAGDAEDDPSPSIPDFRGVRTADALYVEYGTNETELYDLRTDPYELDNLWKLAPRSVLDGFRTYLHNLQDCSGAACLSAESAPAPPVR
jgi:arylsulfatase A-like enzyme